MITPTQFKFVQKADGLVIGLIEKGKCNVARANVTSYGMSYKSGMFCSRKVDLSRTRVTNALLVMWIYGMLTHTIEGDPTQAGLEMGVDVVG